MGEHKVVVCGFWIQVSYTVGQINQEYRLKYWATRLSTRLFTSTAHSFASLARSAVLTLLTPKLMGQWMI